MPRVKMPENPETVWLVNKRGSLGVAFGPVLVLKRTAKIVRVERSGFSAFREEVKTDDPQIAVCVDERQARLVALAEMAKRILEATQALVRMEKWMARVRAGDTPDHWGEFKGLDEKLEGG